MHTLFNTKPSSQDYKTYLIVFLTAIITRTLFLVFIDEPILFVKYPFFAEKLANGADIGERLGDLSPFYLYFLTILKRVFDVDWTLVKYVHSFVGALNCLLVFAVGTRAFRKEVGFLGALIFAAYGNLIILESTLEPTVFVLLFNLATVYFLLRVRDDGNSPGRRMLLSLLAGLFAGLSIITKPNFLLFLPLGAVWLLFFAGVDFTFHKRLSNALFFCGAALLLVMPITVRNYVKLHDFVLVTADAGKVFYHGNGKGASALEGTGLPSEGFAEEGFDEPDYAHVLYRKTAAGLSGKDLTPSESSKFWMRKAFGDILSDPTAYAILEIKKLFYFFNDYEMHYIASAYKEYKKSLSFPFIRYGIVACLGLLGMTLSLRRSKDLFLVYGMVFVYLLSGMLLLVQSRYRTPAVPYFCLFAGSGIYEIKQMLAARKLKPVAAALVMGAVLFFFTNLFYRQEIVSVDHWQQATKIHYQMGGAVLFDKGKFKEAVAELEKCIAMVPNFTPAYNLRGRAYAIFGNYKAAADDFKKVISSSPNLPQGYKNLGFVYMLQGNTQPAKTHLLKARALSPGDTRVKEALVKLEQHN